MLLDLPGTGRDKSKNGASPFESHSASAHFAVAQAKLHIVPNNITPVKRAFVRASKSLHCESSRLCLDPRSRDWLHVCIV